MMNRLPIYLLAILFLGVNSCTDRSGNIPIEKAEQLSRQANDELRNLNYKNAERLLAESIELYSAADNTAKLAEQYASLASLQSLSGKLPEAVQSLSTLRTLYRQVADRTAELNTMLDMARHHIRLNNTEEAERILKEAYLSGQLYQLEKPYAAAALQLGNLYASFGKHTQAVQYLSVAAAQFLQLADTVNAIESIAAVMSSLLQRGKRSAALQYFAQCENTLRTNNGSVDKGYSYALCGFAFLRAHEWVLAKRSFEKSLTLHQAPAYLPLLGMGEVMYYNFAFDDAQRFFVTAYKSAKDHLNPLEQAYLLIRIGDCEVKKNTFSYNHEKFIRATQLYEHAQTLCSKAGYAFGEAVILHRFGLLKEISGDHYTAVTYYRRSFDKFMTADILTVPVNSFTDFENLMITFQHRTMEESFSAPLISLLLHGKNYGDALEYAERARARTLQRLVSDDNLEFKDQKKQQQFVNVGDEQKRVTGLERALFYFRRNSDNDHAIRLQQQLQQSKKNLVNAVSTLAQAYPEFNFINAAKKIPDITREFLPQSVTALRYYFSANEAWLFVIRQDEPVTATKISSFGFELKEKMSRFIDLVRSDEAAGFELKQLANELYDFLVRPAEPYQSQRFLILPPEGWEKFPFHALTKSGRTLIEATEVSYLPSLYFLRERKHSPRFITNVVAAGFTSDARWGLEFELRDIRSFFKNAQVIVKQSATPEKLGSVSGEFLHLASLFNTTVDGEYSMTLSDGSPSVMGVSVPLATISSFTQFPFVYVADIDAKSNFITVEHTLIWLMNGTQSLVVNELPITPKMSRSFNEELYAIYASTFSPYTAYRQAMMQLNKQKEFSEEMKFAAFFFYGL
ncbi:MAG: CHAT domain-containing protein [Bacteroidota bacterium]